MSLKNGPDRQPSRGWSLALTLMAYYSLSAFLIVFVATAYLYLAMVRNLDLEDDRLLADRVRLLQTLLTQRPLDLAIARQEVDQSWQGGQRTQVLIRILDAQGQLVCESKGMIDVLPVSFFPAASEQTGFGLDMKSMAGRVQRVMAVKLPESQEETARWIVQVGMDRGEEAEILDDYRENLIMVLGASLIVCAVLGYYVTRRGVQPLKEITDAVRGTQPSNLSDRLNSSGLPQELKDLVDTFNSLMERLDQAFQRLSGFTADIAHELRTPVNNIRGELDVALSKVRSSDEYEEIIGSSLEELSRLSRTIESLLFLARSENPQTQISREEVWILAELQRIADFFSPMSEDAGVSLEIDGQPDLTATLNRALFQQAIGNLITNSISHTPREGRVTVRARQAESTMFVEVIDTGTGIPVEHIPHVFNRFYRADYSSQNHRAGLGLGLSIVKSIVELHDGQIELQSEVGVGTTVRLKFPNSKMSRS